MTRAEMLLGSEGAVDAPLECVKHLLFIASHVLLASVFVICGGKSEKGGSARRALGENSTSLATVFLTQ